MEYYAIKKNIFKAFIGKWIYHANILLCETRQAHKLKYL